METTLKSTWITFVFTQHPLIKYTYEPTANGIHNKQNWICETKIAKESSNFQKVNELQIFKVSGKNIDTKLKTRTAVRVIAIFYKLSSSW